MAGAPLLPSSDFLTARSESLGAGHEVFRSDRRLAAIEHSGQELVIGGKVFSVGLQRAGHLGDFKVGVGGRRRE